MTEHCNAENNKSHGLSDKNGKREINNIRLGNTEGWSGIVLKTGICFRFGMMQLPHPSRHSLIGLYWFLSASVWGVNTVVE